MLFLLRVVESRLLAALAVAAHELVHAAGSVHELRLTRVEGVRSRRDFELHEGISFTFEFDRLRRLASGTRQEHVTVGHIFEDNGTVVFGMDTLFHCVVVVLCSFIRNYTALLSEAERTRTCPSMVVETGGGTRRGVLERV